MSHTEEKEGQYQITNVPPLYVMYLFTAPNTTRQAFHVSSNRILQRISVVEGLWTASQSEPGGGPHD